MKGIVWGNRWISAVNQLDKIAIKYKQLHINPVQIVKTKTEYTITYENGDNWRAIRGNTNSRGYKCNISYIDREIADDIVDTVIKPCTTCFPYHGFEYYYPEKD